MTVIVDGEISAELGLSGINDRFALINFNGVDIGGGRTENCNCVGGAGEGIHTDGVGHAVVVSDLGVVSQSFNIAADVNTGGCGAEVLGIQIAVDGNEVDTGEVFSRINNGVFSTFVPDACFAEVCPSGRNQSVFSVFGNEFADNGDGTDGGSSADGQFAAEGQGQSINRKRTRAQSRTGIEDEFIGLDVSGNGHVAENDHFAGVFAVEAAGVDNAASGELAAGVNRDGTLVVDSTSPAESSAVDNIHKAFNKDFQLLIAGVDEFTGIVVSRSIGTVNSQNSSETFVTDITGTAGAVPVLVDITIYGHLTKLQVKSGSSTVGGAFDNTGCTDDEVGFGAVGIGCVIISVNSIGNDQGISLQSTIYGKDHIVKSAMVVDVDVGSGNSAAFFNNTITLDLEPVDIDIAVIADNQIAVSEQFTDTGFINGINLEV